MPLMFKTYQQMQALNKLAFLIWHPYFFMLYYIYKQGSPYNIINWIFHFPALSKLITIKTVTFPCGGFNLTNYFNSVIIIMWLVHIFSFYSFQRVGFILLFLFLVFSTYIFTPHIVFLFLFLLRLIDARSTTRWMA